LKAVCSYLAFFAFLSFGFAQVTFTEVMYDPATSEAHDEYIEIYNLSSEIADLTGWQFSDSSSFDGLVEAGEGLLLNPGQFAVILDGSYFGNSTSYDGIIPDSALIIKIDGNSFGLTNSNPKLISLIDSSGKTIDSYRYTIGLTPGHSNEKIILNAGNEAVNWAEALVSGGTPGQRNSVTPYKTDLGLGENSLSWSPSFNLAINQDVHFKLTISNAGSNKFDAPLNVMVFSDVENDSIFSENDMILFENSASVAIPTNETIQIDFIHQFGVAAKYNLVAQIESNQDINPINNQSFASLQILDNSVTLHINEIKFLAEEGEPEWLELYNSGEKKVSLEGWGIADKKDTVLVDSAVFIHPGQYKIIAEKAGLDTLYVLADSLIVVLPKLPTFNNGDDVIFLLNPLGGWLEQVPYENDWLEGEEGRMPSLERINYNLDSRLQRNWGPSVAGENATPGMENSLYTVPGETLKSSLAISPNPFSPDNDGHEDHALISVKLPLSTARIKVVIFDMLGRKRRTLRDNSFSGENTTVVWDGRDDAGRKVRMGIYIVSVQILNDREGVIKELKETVVVARKL
jgi:Lamin Tail Domain